MEGYFLYLGSDQLGDGPQYFWLQNWGDRVSCGPAKCSLRVSQSNIVLKLTDFTNLVEGQFHLDFNLL